MSETFSPEGLLSQWLQRQTSAEAFQWLQEQRQKIETGNTRALFLSFGMVPRKIGKSDLSLTEEDLQNADQARSRWNPKLWTVDQAGRALLVLSIPQEDEKAFLDSLDKLFQAGDVGELVALYQMLPILPRPELHVKRAAEGIRTNIRTVFCAVAHGNPYPQEYLDDVAWNQMVLKALFVETTLDPILGLDERANEKLMTMLVDYAHERWSASRTVSPELWRCVGPFADERALSDMQRVLQDGTEAEKRAATLALMNCPDSSAKEILADAPDLVRQAEAGEFNWSNL